MERKDFNMAYQKKTAATAKTTEEKATVVEKDKETEVNKDVITEVVTEKVEKRKYKNDDVIICKSFTNGKLLVTGEKSGILYRWADYGDIEEVEYQDLIYMIRSHKPSVFVPRFIIQDKELLEDYPELVKLYDSLYSTNDLKDILALPITQMKSAIKELPDSAIESIKGIAASMISSGTFDSAKKIKAFDELLDTHLLLTLAQG